MHMTFESLKLGYDIAIIILNIVMSEKSIERVAFRQILTPQQASRN